ncbi:MAG TPA: hypothetical protein VF361_02930 [Candidatus Limnocylindrales bacterium]
MAVDGGAGGAELGGYLGDGVLALALGDRFRGATTAQAVQGTYEMRVGQ